jgi:NADH-quinone oxidoreductase subunit J
LFIEIIYILKREVSGEKVSEVNVNWLGELRKVSNMEVLSEVLYTYYVYYLILAGIVLLVSMFGTIVLTLHHETSVKRQEIYKQVCRDYRETIKLKR